MKAQVNLAAAVIHLVEAGFWPPNKELKEASKFLEDQDVELARLQKENDVLKAALLPFAKMGGKISGMKITYPDSEVIGFDGATVIYADLLRAADMLHGKGMKAQEEDKE